MQQTDKRLRTRALAFALALALILGLLPGFPGAGETAQAHWADSYLDSMVEWGFIRADQADTPDEVMTRADFMAIINRAYGYTQTGPTPFEDVDVKDWYYDDVGIAYNANYIYGTSPTTVSPNDPLTRETSATILGRNMMLRESEGEILDFSDAREISSWARGTIKSSLEHYLVNGYDDGTFRPQKDLTWGEMAAMVTRIVGMPIQEAGDYALGGVFGNVTVSSDGVTLRDTIISGDLYITGGVGLGGVKLENVTVLGRIIASGSGESEAGAASIVLRNVVADELLVDNLQGNFVTVQADGVTEIGQTNIRTDAYVEDNTPEGLGLKNITLDGEMGTRLDLAGRIETVRVATPNAQVNVAKGTVASMTVDENAPGTNVTIARGAVINELNLDIGTYVSGDGDIKKLNVNAEGCIVTMLPEEVYIRPGITAVINDQIMDSTSAEEAGREPMILAGYPLANDVAPTSFQAVFATNKKGTVYWAVSPITDGSVSTDDLIHPPTYGGISVASGSVAIPAAEELVGATVGTPTTTGNNRPSTTASVLTPGGSYYLAAVLVDDRGVESPTKVIALTLPDDSVPAFAEGYPYFSLITNNMAQITVMPTKTCKLYYAVLPSGAVAPTETEFRANAVVGNLGFGIRDVVKNTEDVFQVNDKTLEELESYDLYLWLVDSDGANKSEIIKLPFTTVDKTPPRFDPEPTPTSIQANAVGLTFQVNEDATVYWVVVPTGTDYPKVNPQTGTKDDAYSRLQIEKGMGNVLSSGNVNVKAFTDGAINVTGLESESAYDLWYVAKDAAGNYSTPVGMVTIYTLDINGPRVRQYFTEYVGEDNTKRPTSETDIVLEFNENVRATDSEGFLELYTAYTRDYNNIDAKNKFLSALKSTIILYKIDPNTGRGAPAPVKGGDGVSDTDWAIDYEQTEVKMVDGALQVIFKNAGLNLDAGSTYYFQLTNLTDVSTAQNPIVPTTVNYSTAESYGHNVPVIEIEFAMVNLSSPGVGAKEAPYERRNAQGQVEMETGTDDVSRPVIQENFTTVDLSFRMIPQSTSRVDDNISYDILLWADTRCEYDLYYRILDKNNQAITDPYETDENGSGKYEQYLLPTKPGYDEADDNGWFYLGYSNAVNPAAGELAGKSINGYFNGCDGTNFPQLNNMSEDLRYEFVITLRKVKTSEDRSSWSGVIHFHNYVAAGWSNRLYSLHRGLRWFTWEEFQKGGLAAGAKSIGAWQNNGVTEDYIDIYQLFTNTSLPKFINGSPTFTTTDTSVTMSLTLDHAGTIYYVIGQADPQGLGTYMPEISTTLHNPDTDDTPEDDKHIGVPNPTSPDEVYIKWNDVPESGTELQPGGTVTGALPDDSSKGLILPDPQNIFDPSDWADASGAFRGSVNYMGVANTPETVNNLLPDTEYYAYFVLKGAAQDLSRVYIYRFKTEISARPKISLVDKGTGDVDMTTDVATNSYYRVLTQADAQNTGMNNILNAPFKDFINEKELGGLVPDNYKTDTFTVLDALTGPYSRPLAVSAATPSGSTTIDDYYFPMRNNSYTFYNEGYTIFDIYASTQARQVVYNLISSGTGTPPSYTVSNNLTWGPSGPTATPSDWGSHTISMSNDPRINWDTFYVVLTRAQSTSAGTVEDPSQINSYSAAIFRKSNLNSPNVNGVSVEMNRGDSAGQYSGTITIMFDQEIYLAGRVKPTTSNIFTSGKVSGYTGCEITNVTPTSFDIKFTNVPAGRNLTFMENLFCNYAEAQSTERLMISWKESGGTAFVDITWGPDKDGRDYAEWLNQSPIPATSTENNATISLSAGSGIVLGGGYRNGYTLTMNSKETPVPSGSTSSSSATITARIDPEGANATVNYWTTSDRSVVTVTPNGFTATVNAVGIGTATITVSVHVINGTQIEDVTQTLTITVDGAITFNSITNNSNGGLTGSGNALTWDLSTSSSNTAVSSVSGEFTVNVDPSASGAIVWTSSSSRISVTGSASDNGRTVYLSCNGGGNDVVTLVGTLGPKTIVITVRTEGNLNGMNISTP